MLKCYRNDKGFAHADAPVGKELLGSFVVDDIQGSLTDCKEMLDLSADVENGTRRDWSGTGNAHAVTMTQDGVRIENLWDESLGSTLFSFGEFREAVQDWLTFIRKDKE
jgi:uncharacterized protein YacL (UPF0231 family)